MTIQKEAEADLKSAARQAEGSARSIGKAATKTANAASSRVLDESKAVVTKMDTGYHQWMGWAMDSFQTNLAAMQAMMTSRSAKEVMAIQSQLIQDQMGLLMSSGRSMGSLPTTR